MDGLIQIKRVRLRNRDRNVFRVESSSGGKTFFRQELLHEIRMTDLLPLREPNYLRYQNESKYALCHSLEAKQRQKLTNLCCVCSSNTRDVVIAMRLYCNA